MGELALHPGEPVIVCPGIVIEVVRPMEKSSPSETDPCCSLLNGVGPSNLHGRNAGNCLNVPHNPVGFTKVPTSSNMKCWPCLTFG